MAQHLLIFRQNPLVLLALFVIVSVTAGAQGPDEALTAVPSRPNFANATDTVPRGEVQAEFGFTRQWMNARERGTGLNGTYGLGITRKLDIRWSSDHVLTSRTAGTTRVGTGDNWIGARYRFTEQSRWVPSVGLLYQFKLPTSDPGKNLGSGFLDHSIAALFSKDFGDTRADWNLVQFAFGSDSGWRSSTIGALALSRTVRGRLSGLIEAYGGSSADGDGVASMLTAVTWRWNLRLVCDAGVEFGLTQNVPRKRFVAGISYAVTKHPWGRAKQLAAIVRH